MDTLETSRLDSSRSAGSQDLWASLLWKEGEPSSHIGFILLGYQAWNHLDDPLLLAPRLSNPGKTVLRLPTSSDNSTAFTPVDISYRLWKWAEMSNTESGSVTCTFVLVFVDPVCINRRKIAGLKDSTFYLFKIYSIEMVEFILFQADWPTWKVSPREGSFERQKKGRKYDPEVKITCAVSEWRQNGTSLCWKTRSKGG